MEKENSQKRSNARVQYNQTVSRLVSLCKQLDPRYEVVLQEREEEERKREEEKQRREESQQQKRAEEMMAKMQTCVTEVQFDLQICYCRRRTKNLPIDLMRKRLMKRILTKPFLKSMNVRFVTRVLRLKHSLQTTSISLT